MVQRNLILSIATAGLVLLAGGSSRAEGEMDSASMAKALPQASVSLQQGLKASAPAGMPISAKFEIERGALQLSVYTMKGGKFTEVIVDHKSGAIATSKPITEGDDLKEAQVQSEALAKGWMELDAALENALSANAGYRAVSIEPVLKGGRVFARITLMNGPDVRKVSEPLY
jgi:hypothetical protein